MEDAGAFDIVGFALKKSVELYKILTRDSDSGEMDSGRCFFEVGSGLML